MPLSPNPDQNTESSSEHPLASEQPLDLVNEALQALDEDDFARAERIVEKLQSTTTG